MLTDSFIARPSSNFFMLNFGMWLEKRVHRDLFHTDDHLHAKTYHEFIYCESLSM